MSKAFKILVDIIIAICIVGVLALVVPPLVGVSTQVSAPDMDSNYSLGTVIYGSRKPVSELKTGDEIVYTGETFSYIYEVKSTDAETGEVEVVNNVSKEEGYIQISKTVVKKYLAVPFIGYVLLAMQTETGKLMLLFGALFLVMLFVVAAILDHKRKQKKMALEDAQADREEEDDRYFAALTQSMEKPSSLEIAYNEAADEAAQQAKTADTAKLEEAPVDELILKSAAPEEKANDEQLAATRVMSDPIQKAEKKESVASNKKSKKKAKKAEKAKEKLAAKETEEQKSEETVQPEVQTEVPEEEYKYIPPVGSKAYDADNIADAFAEVPDEESAASHDLEESELPDVSAALVAALSTTQVNRTYQQPPKVVEETPEPEQLDEIELAIPVKTAEEILDEAYAKGYDPEVIQDSVTNVKLIDFSDCLVKTDE